MITTNHCFITENLAFPIYKAHCAGCHKWVLGQGVTLDEIVGFQLANSLQFPGLRQTEILEANSDCHPMIDSSGIYHPYIPLLCMGVK